MKFRDEYRDPIAAERILSAIRASVSRRWTIMEVCGGQTHSIVRYGIGDLLPPEVELVHGPGCPVCVTPLELIDQAIALATQPQIIFCSFGDMLRVPGSHSDLLTVKAQGGDVRIVYSPLDCLRIADQNPDRIVVFFAVGFETTAPANAMAVWQAKRRGIRNFMMLVSHVLAPPAMAAIMAPPDNRVQGFLAAGHVCTIMGCREYEPLAQRFQVPIVITGFEPLDLLDGIYHCVQMLEQHRFGVENRYARAVRWDGNLAAQRVLEEVFEISDRAWRGIGVIPNSGYRLTKAYADFDAERLLADDVPRTTESPVCISGLILQGIKKPHECPAFGGACTPGTPLGATMVSSEGACAAYYHYGRRCAEPSRMELTQATMANAASPMKSND